MKVSDIKLWSVITVTESHIVCKVSVKCFLLILIAIAKILGKIKPCILNFILSRTT